MMDFAIAESVVVKNGRRLLCMNAVRSTTFIIECDLRAQDLEPPFCQLIEL